MSTTWLTLEEVRARLRISKDTLRERMRETPPHVARAWVDMGSGGKRAVYQFEEAKIDSWWREVNEWRASVRIEGSGKSGGVTQTGAREAASAKRSASPKSSDTKSKRPTPSAESGNYLALLRPQTSRPA